MAEYTQTINELVDTLLSRCRSTIGTSAPLYPHALRDLNLALQKLVTLYNWKWLKKEVTLSVPANTRILKSSVDPNYPKDVLNFIEVIGVMNGVKTTLREISDHEASILYPDLTATGNPIHYTLGAAYLASTTVPPERTIELRPAPNMLLALTVIYKYTVKKYTSSEGAEVPPIPQNYYLPLIELAAARLNRHIKNPLNEIQDAEIEGLKILKELARHDSDLNKIRKMDLSPEVRSYRAGRYKTGRRRYV